MLAPISIYTMKYLFYPLFLLFAISLSAEIRLKDKVKEGKPGDYIVAEQGSHQSLLLLRAIEGNKVLFEEITIPSDERKKSSLAWDEWLKNKAPGHTSWIAYEIDLEKDLLLECYSFSRQGWLLEQNHFFTQLLSLDLEKGRDAERKKIGPPPLDGEIDRRSFWIPAKIVQGKKYRSPRFEFFVGKWPQDSSDLSGCAIETYFDLENPSFPFPYWIDIKSSHYTMRISIIDSGRDLISPQSNIPSRQKPLHTTYEQQKCKFR
jgi:hypothetical protein